VDTPNRFNTADYSAVLMNVDTAGVRRLDREALDALSDGAGAAGCLVQRVDLRRARTKADALAELGRALRFPEWFGQNWDALSDCLLDMGWQPAVGYVTVLEHCDGLRERATEDFNTLLDIFQTAADDWREQGVPFWCLVELSSDDQSLAPLVSAGK